VSVDGCGRDAHTGGELIEREPFDVGRGESGIEQGLLQISVVKALDVRR
jgi:hypothetical protein